MPVADYKMGSLSETSSLNSRRVRRQESWRGVPECFAMRRQHSGEARLLSRSRAFSVRCRANEAGDNPHVVKWLWTVSSQSTLLTLAGDGALTPSRDAIWHAGNRLRARGLRPGKVVARFLGLES